MTRFLLISTFVLSLTILTGCEKAKEQLGLTRHTPDEFTVMERAPLEVPADLNQLPPPRPGAPRPQETPVAVAAKSAVLGNDSVTQGNTANGPSAAEARLVSKAASASAAMPADIRATVNAESDAPTVDKRPVLKRLMGWGSKDKSSTVVDANKEAQRIQKQKSSGQKITGAETPTVEQ